MDKNQFRPASQWFSSYLPKTLTDALVTRKKIATSIILYVTRNDARYMEEEEINFYGSTLWISSRNKIPKPKWSCQENCIPNIDIRLEQMLSADNVTAFEICVEQRL